MRYTTLIIALFLAVSSASAQHTFSIVAVDSLTGEIGSAGATCLTGSGSFKGALIISDVIPGRGAIHTQAQWDPDNQQFAHDRMVEGMSPAEIIAWITSPDNDASNTPEIRQYGIVDFDSSGHPRAAGYTGTGCLDYKNNITKGYYSIQGNILLGPQILDSMEARFLRTQGPLADKLMAALQGAKVIGADTRCADSGMSSASSFIRVARPGDKTGALYLEIIVPSTKVPRDPIDSLQTLFDIWKGTQGVATSYDHDHYIFLSYEAKMRELKCDVTSVADKAGYIDIIDVGGRRTYTVQISDPLVRIARDNIGLAGAYFLLLKDKSGKILTTRKFLLP
jgi:uncharacterized Ntn-hydrolase superfamily protein